jgi:hypothetical protein
MIPRYARRAAALCLSLALTAVQVAHAAEPASTPVKPAISDDVNAAVSRMGKSLLARDLSFTARIIRVYLDESGQPLHIFHTLKVVVSRPDRLAVRSTGDDGVHELFYDGRSVAIFFPERKQYALIRAVGNVASALGELQNKLAIDFPLVDFFTDAPDRTFLAGFTAGWQVGTNRIDGVECRHLFFSRRGGIDIQLWVENNDAAIPRRLIVSYRLLPGQPEFIAEFANWDASTPRSEAEFAFLPPAGAKKVEFGEPSRL